MIDLCSLLSSFMRVITKISGNVVISQWVSHLHVDLFLLLEKGWVSATWKQTAEIIKIYQLLSLGFLLTFSIVYRKRFYDFETFFLSQILEEHLLIKLSKLRSWHDRILVIPDHINQRNFIISTMNFVLIAVLFEDFGQIFFDWIETK